MGSFVLGWYFSYRKCTTVAAAAAIYGKARYKHESKGSSGCVYYLWNISSALIGALTPC